MNGPGQPDFRTDDDDWWLAIDADERWQQHCEQLNEGDDDEIPREGD